MPSARPAEPEKAGYRVHWANATGGQRAVPLKGMSPVPSLRSGRMIRSGTRPTFGGETDDFEGSREDAISWARSRCLDVLVWSPELGDVVPVAEE